MTRRRVRALLVEDSVEDLENATRLSREELECYPFRTIGDPEEFRNALRKEIEDRKIDLVILDYRLDDEVDAAGQRLPLRGGAVAADIREEFPWCPIVLLTTEEKLQRWLAKNPTVYALFDRQILKSELNTTEGRAHAVRCIVDLARGYSAIAGAIAKKTAMWEAVAAQMRASEAEAGLLPQFYSEPPGASASAVASWFHRALRWPGLLINGAEVTARIGLAPKALGRTELIDWLAPAAYTGAFGGCVPRWWRGRLAERLHDADPSLPRAALKLIGLSASFIGRCEWCGEETVFRPCSVCGEPVDRPHHLTATVDDRPRWSDSALVCFSCIQRGRADDISFPAGAAEIAEEIRRGKLKPSRRA